MIESLPAHIFATQYQQIPTAMGSGPLLLRHFPVVDSTPSGGNIVVSWDTAWSLNERSSYSVALVFQVFPDVAYLKHIFRERVPYADLKRRALNLHERFGPTHHLVENAASGVALATDLREVRANVIDIKLGHPSKLDRILAVQHRVEANYVQLARGHAWP